MATTGLTSDEKEPFQVEVDSLSDQTIDSPLRTIILKWKYWILNVEKNPVIDTIFDGEPYTIDNLLEYESENRLDKANAPRWKKAIGFIWDPIFLPPAERKYMLKIDFFIFIYAILACFIKYLDQTNINNAFVSGMKEDLNMYGSNDFNLLTTYFNIGYLAFSIFMATSIKYIRPSIILPTCEVLWTIAVMCQAAAKNKETIFGLRLIQGILEASSFPGLTLLIGEYYSVESLGKKMFMMNATNSIAGMFAGYIQAGAYKNLNGVHGLAGWQWVMLVDGFISLPVAFLGYYCIPDFPKNSRAHWMTKKDRQFALARNKRFQKAQPAPMTVVKFLKVFVDWRLWLFIGPYVLNVIGARFTSYFITYLKGLERFSVEQVNLIPTAQNGWAFVISFIVSAFSDYYGNRPIFITICVLQGIIGSAILVAWNVPFGAKVFAFIFGAGASAPAQTLTISWFAETFYDVSDLKALNVGVGNTIVYSFNAFLPLAIFKAKDSPAFPVGYKICLVFYLLGVVATWNFDYWSKYYNKKRESKRVASEEDQGQSDDFSSKNEAVINKV
jgi:ACS family pantothenate transporter-like MFS transporter